MRYGMLLVWALLSAVFVLPALPAMADEEDGQIEQRVFTSEDLGTMPYRILKPKNYDADKKYPLVLCLHGAGGRGTGNQSKGSEAFAALSDEKVQKKYPAFLVTPQCPKNKRWVNTDWGKGSYSIEDVAESDQLKLVMMIVDALEKEFSIDPARVYVTGQSMGGYGTWDMILRHPERFAAAVPVCGAGDPSKAELITDLPIWVFHGDKDKAVPVEGSRDMVKAVKDAGGKKLKYTEYAGVGHASWKQAWSDKKMIAWLFKQKK